MPYAFPPIGVSKRKIRRSHAKISNSPANLQIRTQQTYNIQKSQKMREFKPLSLRLIPQTTTQKQHPHYTHHSIGFQTEGGSRADVRATKVIPGVLCYPPETPTHRSDLIKSPRPSMITIRENGDNRSGGEE